ncbi:MAG: carboxymuconolactone decarboxylase family protein [Porticoccaceae bacterium]|jgi:alkylhydroperoxidase/carboxymuconolactone decarboxylase family protein YurZ|nr:carboxymuconolactone decarboxylase family protein [Porticoccaceae bacterium]
MSKQKSLNEYLAAVDPDVAASFRALRGSAQKSGDLSSETLELITLASFATARMELAFKGHAKRACENGLPKASVQHAVVTLLGASLPMATVVETLQWLDDVTPA